MKFKKVFLVFAVSLLIIGFFSFSSPIFSGVKAQMGSPSIVDSLTGLPIHFSETSDYVKLNFTMFIVEFTIGDGN